MTRRRESRVTGRSNVAAAIGSVVTRLLRDFAVAGSIAFSALGSLSTLAQAAEPLMLETRVPLGEIPGRIDHLAYDTKRARLIVAELGNNSVSILDLDQRALIHRISGLNTPQGVA